MRGYSNPQNRPRSRPRLSLEEGNAQIAIKVQKIEDEEDSETNQALGPMITPQFPWLFLALFATNRSIFLDDGTIDRPVDSDTLWCGIRWDPSFALGSPPVSAADSSRRTG